MKSGEDNPESATLRLVLMTIGGAHSFFIINQTLFYSLTLPYHSYVCILFLINVKVPLDSFSYIFREINICGNRYTDGKLILL